MKLLVLSDNHNDIENMFTFIDILSEHEFDVIIYAGDFSDINTPKGFTQEDVAKIIIEELRVFKRPVVAVPGNNDDKNIIDLINKENISVHGKGKIINNVGFYGFGGAQTPFNTSYEPKDEEIKKGLERAFIDVMKVNKKVQITHTPPIDTKLDYINTGMHVGSRVVRNFIEKYSPFVAVSAHIHEARGIDYINNTLLINPGRFAEGYVGFVDINKERPEAKIINLIE